MFAFARLLLAYDLLLNGQLPAGGINVFAPAMPYVESSNEIRANSLAYV